MINKDYFQEILGDEYKVTQLIEDVDSVYVFYVTKEYYESGGNDNYQMIGIGPLLFDKKTNKISRLGALEFHEKHSSNPIFNSSKHQPISIVNLICNVKERKHINIDEIDEFMTIKEMDMNKLNIYSSDFSDLTISSEYKPYIDEFIELFHEANIEYLKVDDHKIVLEKWRR